MADDAWKTKTCDGCRFVVIVRRIGGRWSSGDCRFGPPTPTPDHSTYRSMYPEVDWTTPACSQYQRSE
jgi:hypothetical protein